MQSVQWIHRQSRPTLPRFILASKLFTRGLHYPTLPNPSPYQIFGLSPGSTIDKRKLKKVYYEFVKVYHPDRGSTGDAEKFKRIVAAHEILQNDSKRYRYDMTARDQARQSPNPQNSNYNHPYNPSYNQAYQEYNWRTRDGKWQGPDADEFAKWEKEAGENFERDMYESKMFVLKTILVSTVLFTILNFLFMSHIHEERAENTERMNRKLALDLDRTLQFAGKTSQDRIDKFLHHRQDNLEKMGRSDVKQLEPPSSNDS